jgi:hypothetical protein
MHIFARADVHIDKSKLIIKASCMIIMVMVVIVVSMVMIMCIFIHGLFEWTRDAGDDVLLW